MMGEVENNQLLSSNGSNPTAAYRSDGTILAWKWGNKKPILSIDQTASPGFACSLKPV